MGRASSVDFFLAGAAGALDFLAGAGAQLLGRVRAPVSFGQGWRALERQKKIGHFSPPNQAAGARERAGFFWQGLFEINLEN